METWAPFLLWRWKTMEKRTIEIRMGKDLIIHALAIVGLGHVLGMIYDEGVRKGREEEAKKHGRVRYSYYK